MFIISLQRFASFKAFWQSIMKEDRGCFNAKTIAIVSKGLKWTIYIGFGFIAGLFMKDVLKQYQSKDTFMGQSLEPISKLPTVVICLDSRYYWSYSNGFVVMEYAVDTFNFKILKENEILYMEEGNETVFFEQYSEFCFKMKVNTGSKIKTGALWSIKVTFPNLSEKFIPETLSAYFTSEENSYGAYYNQWFDGQVFEQKVKRNSWVVTTLKPIQYKYLDIDNQCSDETFLEQWQKYIPKTNFSGCPRKCAPFSFLASKEIPICGWSDEESPSRGCALDAFLIHYNEFRTIIGYKRPCHVLEYSGQTTYDKERFTDNKFLLRYQFAPPEKKLYYTERLVVDTIGMIGSVGGTLGIFIGFSFSGITTNVLDFIMSRIRPFI